MITDQEKAWFEYRLPVLKEEHRKNRFIPVDELILHLEIIWRAYQLERAELKIETDEY